MDNFAFLPFIMFDYSFGAWRPTHPINVAVPHMLCDKMVFEDTCLCYYCFQLLSLLSVPCYIQYDVFHFLGFQYTGIISVCTLKRLFLHRVRDACDDGLEQ